MMKNWIAFVLFILIGPFVMWGAEELLDHLNQEHLWNMSDRAIRWSSIIIMCLVVSPLSDYLSEKIKQIKK